MAKLKAVVEKIEEVEEAHRGLYVQREDKKFQLDAEGVEDVSGLKSALEAERRISKALDRKVKDWEKLGKTPEEIQQLAAKFQKDEEDAARKAGDFDKILGQHQQKWADEKKQLETELSAARESERHAIISTSLMTSLTKSGATAEGIDLLPDRLTSRIKFEVKDGKRVLTILAADGETPMAGSAKDGKATFDDLVKEAAEKWPSLFKGSGQSGGGTPPDKGGEGHPAGGAGDAKRSTMKIEAKAAYIAKHGQEAYNRLPW